MLTKDVIQGGATRLRAGGCGFLFTRLAVGLLYTTVNGTDIGALGPAPLEEVTAEFNRFKRPIKWFVDAELAPSVVPKVLDQWTAWLENHQNLFERLHVLTNSKHMNLTMEVAKHFSNMHRSMTVYDDRSAFEQALIKSCGTTFSADANWFTAQPIEISKTVEKDGTISISNSNTSFTIKRLNDLSLWSTIYGIENGSLSNLPFDLVSTELFSAPKKLTWYVDCSGVTRLDQRVLDAWTQWAQANEQKLESLHMYVPSGAIPILIDIAKSKSNMHKLIHLYQDKESFNRVCSRTSPECSVL